MRKPITTRLVMERACDRYADTDADGAATGSGADGCLRDLLAV